LSGYAALLTSLFGSWNFPSCSCSRMHRLLTLCFFLKTVFWSFSLWRPPPPVVGLFPVSRLYILLSRLLLSSSASFCFANFLSVFWSFPCTACYFISVGNLVFLAVLTQDWILGRRDRLVCVSVTRASLSGPSATIYLVRPLPIRSPLPNTL